MLRNSCHSCLAVVMVLWLCFLSFIGKYSFLPGRGHGFFFLKCKRKIELLNSYCNIASPENSFIILAHYRFHLAKEWGADIHMQEMKKEL